MRIVVRVDNRVRVPRGLPDTVLNELREAFKHENPEHLKRRRMGLPTAGEPPVYRTWKDEGDHVSFPRGGASRVKAILQGHRIDFGYDDQRTAGDPRAMVEAQSVPSHRYQLWEHQLEAVRIAQAKQNCIIRAPTGSGKTTIGFALHAALKLPTLIIVPDSGLFNQWKDRAEKELGLKPRQVGTVRAGKLKLRPLTIAIQQSIPHLTPEQMDEMTDYFGAVICDEVQRFAAKTFFASIDPFPARYRIGISADESRKDRKEFLIYDQFGAVAYDVPRTDLVEKNLIHDVEIRVVPTKFASDSHGDFNKLLEEMQHSEHRNGLVETIVKREVARGEQVMVFSHRVDHVRSLEQRFTSLGFPSGTMIGGPDNEEVTNATKARLASRELLVGVGTVQAIGTGLDIPRISVGVLSTPLASNRQQLGQVRGRMCRIAEGKQGARLYYLWDRNYYGLKHLENLIRWNTKVVVLDDGSWVEAKEYVKGLRYRRMSGGSAA